MTDHPLTVRVRKVQALHGWSCACEHCGLLRDVLTHLGGEQPATLQRYGVTWTGTNINDPLLSPRADGYWTPWHQAESKIASLRASLAQIEGELRSQASDLAVLSDTDNHNAQVAAVQMDVFADRLAALQRTEPKEEEP